MTPLDTYPCPACGVSNQERLCVLFLDLMNNSKFVSMIHFAPERALSRHIRQKNLFACYATADKNMVEANFHVDLQDLPFKDESDDFFICSHVLEHVPDDGKALRELYRITRSGGCGLLMVPVCMEIKKNRGRRIRDR
jgi:SAM-dependent methyltransferase